MCVAPLETVGYLKGWLQRGTLLALWGALGRVRGVEGRVLILMATLGSTAVTLLPFLRLPTCPQATNIQGLEYITKEKG